MINEIEKTLSFLFVYFLFIFSLIDPSIVSDFQSTASLTNNHNHNHQNDEKEVEVYEEKSTSTI